MAKRHYPKSDHFDGKKFFNPQKVTTKSLWQVLKWQLAGNQKSWPKWVQNKAVPAPQSPDSEKSVAVTFINHATYLFQTKSLNILIDPVFSNRVSPSQLIGPKRVRAPGLSLEKLPKIDLVLVTHNHYDHLDIEAIKCLEKLFNPIFVVPLGNAEIREKQNFSHVKELDWWESFEVSDLKVTLTPAQHWSGRSLSDRYESLWGGFYLEFSNKKIFWAGDTGYSKHFHKICKKLGTPDLSFLPIGAYEPRWFMKDMHMNPRDAVKAHQDLQTPLSIGMHYGTFQLTDESLQSPAEELEIAKKQNGISNFIVLLEGETRVFHL